MEKQLMTRQQKVAIIVCVILAVLLVAFFGFMIYITFHTSSTVRNKMIKHYSNENNYAEVHARIAEAPKLNKGKKYVLISVQFIGEIDERFTNNGSSGFEMPLSDYDVMVSNGLDFENREAVYKFLATPAIWWDGGFPFAAAVFSEDGQTTYLDYETGKKNLLYYIKNDLD